MTQMQQARQGRFTPAMRQAAEWEGLELSHLQQGVAEGSMVIPKNIHHDFSARAIGKGLKTKVNANIGTSEKHCYPEEELKKLDLALQSGADSVMDLSTGGDLEKIRRMVIAQSPLMVGTVPIYSLATELIRQGKEISGMTAQGLLAEIEQQAKGGVDFMTLHCGVTKASLSFLERDERILGLVSRGGSLLKRWMEENDHDNPLYTDFDRLLDICESHDVTISLGDGLRPGAGADASDRGQIAELLILGELVERARRRGVQVMVEGPGHMPLDQIEMNIRLMKQVCHQAPFYVLGPLTTDIAPGYDHIVSSIGGALAAAHGADFLCYVTPAEHLCLPNLDDVKQGIMACRIAAHSGDLVKGIKGAEDRDRAISKARRRLDWEQIYRYALDPELASRRRAESESAQDQVCTMCGNLCAIKINRD